MVYTSGGGGSFDNWFDLRHKICQPFISFMYLRVANRFVIFRFMAQEMISNVFIMGCLMPNGRVRIEYTCQKRKYVKRTNVL